MKQHYLPRFYLEGFQDPEIPKGQTPYVWLYRKKDREWKKRAPHRVATESDRYSFVDSAGVRHDEIEKYFSRIEGEVATILREKLAKERVLDDRERGVLALFVAAMLERVPGTIREELVLLHGKGRKELARQYHYLYESDFRGMYEQVVGSKVPEPDSLTEKDWELLEVTSERRRLDRRGGFARLLYIQWLLIAVPLATRVLGEMCWTFITSRAPYYFISSDNPVVVLDPRLWKSRVGIRHKGVEISVHLSSTIAAVATWSTEGHTGTYRDAFRTKLVSDFNRRVFYFAHEFLVAPKPQFPGSKVLEDERYYDERWRRLVDEGPRTK